METKNTFKKYQYLFIKLASALLLGCALITSSAQAVTDSDWFAIGNGTNGSVYATVWNGTDLYIGGSFDTVYNPDQTPVTANHVAKWDGSNWSALDSGTDGVVYALAWDGGNLYVGGDFTVAGGVSTNDIAKWDGSGWSAFGGTNDYSYVKALAWGGSNLYAGGSFTTVGGVSANYIARWNGSNWSTLGLGTYHPVVALAWDGNNLYAGGRTLDKWNGSSWSNLGLPGIRVLAWDGSNLYAGGDFNTGWGISENYIAKWNGSSWSSLGSGMNAPVNALLWDGSTLYAGGDFTTAGGVSTNHIAQWDGSSWSSLASGTDNAVNALAWDGSDLYVGGDFNSGGNATANYVAGVQIFDTTPEPFSFLDLENVALSTLTYSSIVPIWGIDPSAPISITGGEYSIASSPYTSADGFINNLYVVQLRTTSSASEATPVEVVLTIGGVSDTWTVTTGPDYIPAPFSFTDQSNVALNTLTTSNYIFVTSISVPLPISITGGEYSINGGPFISTAGTVENNTAIAVRTTSSASWSTPVDVVLTVGGVSDTFTVTTESAP